MTHQEMLDSSKAKAELLIEGVKVLTPSINKAIELINSIANQRVELVKAVGVEGYLTLIKGEQELQMQILRSFLKTSEGQAFRALLQGQLDIDLAAQKREMKRRARRAERADKQEAEHEARLERIRNFEEGIDEGHNPLLKGTLIKNK